MAMNAGGGGIRLRPLEIGDVLDETFRVYKRQFVPLITTMGVVVVPTTVLSLPFALLAGVDQRTLARFLEDTRNLGAVIGGVAVIFLLSIVAGLAQLVASGAAVRVASDGILGRPTSVREAYRESFGRFGSLLSTSFCVGIAVGLLIITCIGIPFAVYLGLGWSLVFQAIVLEGHGAFDAMRRSSELVDGHRWRLLVCLVLIGLIVWLLISIPTGLFSFVAGIVIAASGSTTVLLVTQIGNALFQAAGQTLFGAIGLVTATLLYYDLRVRKEAFDLQQRLPGVEIVQPRPFGQQPTQYPPHQPYPPAAPGYPPHPQQPPAYLEQQLPRIPPPPPAPPAP